jgi:phage terminase small subunit
VYAAHNRHVMAAKKRKWKSSRSTRPFQGELSLADERFCQHFAEHGNATAAYRQSGYHNSAGADDAVRQAARYNLTKAHIALRIREVRRQALDALQVTPARIASSFAHQAFADRTAIFNADGTMKHPRQWPAELRAIVAGVELIPPKRAGGRPRYKVRFESSTEAKKVLAQWRGMIGEREAAPTAAGDRVVIEGDGAVDG